MDDIAQTIICRQLLAGHVVGSRPMKRKKNLQRMIMTLGGFCIPLNTLVPELILGSFIKQSARFVSYEVFRKRTSGARVPFE